MFGEERERIEVTGRPVGSEGGQIHTDEVRFAITFECTLGGNENVSSFALIATIIWSEHKDMLSPPKGGEAGHLGILKASCSKPLGYVGRASGYLRKKKNIEQW